MSSTISPDTPFLAEESSNISQIDGVDDQDMPIIRELLRTWRKHYSGNILRSSYYDAHEKLRDLNISIPESVKSNAKAMIAWPAKAVRSLADLTVLEGVSLPNDDDSFGISQLVEDNQLDTEFSQAVVSAYTHSCAFLTISADPDDPTIIRIIPRSADWSAALWDNIRREISAALTITDCDRNGRITSFNVWLPYHDYTCTKTLGRWTAQQLPTNYPHVTVIPISYDAQLNRPFGRSRISPTLMSLVDIGFRTMVRMEATAEFYSSPKLWFLGLDQDAFTSDTWSSLISAVNAVSRDENGDVPAIQQLTQATMSPHSDMLKTVALLVSAETNIPVSDLGIITENPTSAEAMAAAERKLSREADRQNKRFGRAIKQALIQAVTLREGLTATPPELTHITPIWAPTREISDAARADYYTKIAGANSDFAYSDVGLYKAGLTVDEVRSLRAWQQRSQAMANIQQIRDSLTGGDDGQSEPTAATPPERGKPAEPETGSQA